MRRNVAVVRTDNNRLCELRSVADGSVRNTVGPKCCSKAANWRTAAEIAGEAQSAFCGVRVSKRVQFSGHASAKFVDGLIRIGNHRDRDTEAPQPGKNLDILRIAVLTLVNEHFKETCVQGCTKGSSPGSISDLLACLHPCVSGTQRAVPAQSSTGSARCLLVHPLILRHVIPKCLDPDTIRVDPPSLRIKQVEAHSGAGERTAPLKPNVHSQRSPAIDDIWAHITAGDAARKNHEVPDKRIEGANVVRVTEDPLERDVGAPARELFQCSIGEG
jgi:hypothetical protein